MTKCNNSSVYPGCTQHTLYQFHKLAGHVMELCALWKLQSHVGPYGDRNDYNVKLPPSILVSFH